MGAVMTQEVGWLPAAPAALPSAMRLCPATVTAVSPSVSLLWVVGAGTCNTRDDDRCGCDDGGEREAREGALGSGADSTAVDFSREAAQRCRAV